MQKTAKPFSYCGSKTREISFPLGGIGSGCIGLGGSGHLVDWEIFNRPAKGTRNGFSHFAVKAEAAGKVLDARVLHGDLLPPYAGAGTALAYNGFGFGAARETLSGLPHFRDTKFRAAFPLAEICFSDPHFPGEVTLSAFNPFIPLNDADSSLPAAFFSITLRNSGSLTLDYTVAFTLRNPASGKTFNRFLNQEGFPMLHLSGDLPPDAPEYGDFVVATDDRQCLAQEYWFRGRWFDELGVYWQDFNKPGPLPPRHYPDGGTRDHGTLTVQTKIPGGDSKTLRFVFAWNVPNCRNYWKKEAETGETSKNGPAKLWKNYYATCFPDAAASATYCLQNWERLEQDTRRFQKALFSSTLPAPVLDAVSANISILKTPTCLRLQDGSFYGWEGCHASAGCCEGSCTHVWNYACAMPFLFPGLERSMRELDFKHNLRPDGGMAFRLQLPLDSERSCFRPCADGQFGGVLKVYREWKISGDTGWLRQLWPSVRQSLEFAWSPGNVDLWDPKQTGVLHGRQHHTLDMELFGPNAWLTGFYLAALKAAAEMAAVCDELELSEKYRALFARGRNWVRKNLFNGSYFIQKIDLHDSALLDSYREDPAVRATYWDEEHQQLKYQIGEGCGIDQVLAQWHADLMGLGDIFERSQTRSALRSIYRNNFLPSMRNLVNPCRLYCLNDEAGTVMFSWPEGAAKPVIPVPYAEETMHGFEYQAASHLIMHGMVREGVAMVKAVRDRYDGERRNPWNEIECGSNYARSMASYALLNAFSGFQFDMARQSMGFHPTHIPAGGFRCFWSLGTAWGTIEIRSDRAALRVLYGQLAIRSLGLPLADGGEKVTATLGRTRLIGQNTEKQIDFGNAVIIPAGKALRIQAGMRMPADC